MWVRGGGLGRAVVRHAAVMVCAIVIGGAVDGVVLGGVSNGVGVDDGLRAEAGVIGPIDRALLASDARALLAVSIADGPRFLQRLRDSRLGPVAMQSGLLEEPLRAWRLFAKAVEREPLALFEGLTRGGIGLLGAGDEAGEMRVAAIMALPVAELARLRRDLALTPADAIEGCTHLNLEQGRLRVLIAPALLEAKGAAGAAAEERVQLIAVTAGDVPRAFLEVAARAIGGAEGPRRGERLGELPLARQLKHDGDMWILVRPRREGVGAEGGEAHAGAAAADWGEGILIEGELALDRWVFGVRTLERAPRAIEPGLLAMYEVMAGRASSVQVSAVTEQGAGPATTPGPSTPPGPSSVPGPLSAPGPSGASSAPTVLRMGSGFASATAMVTSLAPASTVFMQPAMRRASGGTPTVAEGSLLFSVSHGGLRGTSIGVVSPGLSVGGADELAAGLLRLIDQPMGGDLLDGLLPGAMRTVAYTPRPGHRAYPIVGPAAKLLWWQPQGVSAPVTVMMVSPVPAEEVTLDGSSAWVAPGEAGKEDARLQSVKGLLGEAIATRERLAAEGGEGAEPGRAYFFRSMVRLGVLTESLAPPISLSLKPLGVMETVGFDLWRTGDETIEGELRIDWAK